MTDILLVLPSEAQAFYFNRKLPKNAKIRAVYPAVSALMGWSAELIIIDRDVDLAQNIDGLSLMTVLKQRQAIYPDAKIVIMP